MDVFLVVDMQQGLLRSAPKHDLEAAFAIGLEDTD